MSTRFPPSEKPAKNIFEIFIFLYQFLNNNAKVLAQTAVVQLWYEEALPCETVLFGMVLAVKIGKVGLNPSEALAEVKTLMSKPIQFGGKQRSDVAFAG